MIDSADQRHCWRVLFVHHSAELYGSDRVLLDVVRAVRHAGGDPIVVLPRGGPLVSRLRDEGIETHDVDASRVLKLSRAMLHPAGWLRLAASVPAALGTLDRCVAGRDVHLVHTNTLAALAGALWARRRGVRHVWHVHEVVQRPVLMSRAFPWLVQRLAHEAICNSHATRDWLVAAQPRLALRTQVIWNGVAERAPPGGVAAADDPRRLHARFRPQGVQLAVGLIGRINRMKGHTTLLAAAERLHERGLRDFSLVFVGGPPAGQEHLLTQLRERIAASPLSERVVLHGHTDEPAAAYDALDVVCVPSTEAEGFGLVAVEAMAAGKPVLASQIGGLPEVVLSGRTGLLHPPGDADVLAAQLALLLCDAPRRAALGHAGRARYEAEFRVETMNHHVLHLFKRGALAAT